MWFVLVRDLLMQKKEKCKSVKKACTEHKKNNKKVNIG